MKPIIDETIIKSLKEMETPGDTVPFVDELIFIFLKDASESGANLSLAFKERDVRSVERWAHKLKGQSRNLGAARLSEICDRIEHEAARSLEEVSELSIRSAAKELEDAMQSLRGYLRTAS